MLKVLGEPVRSVPTNRASASSILELASVINRRTLINNVDSYTQSIVNPPDIPQSISSTFFPFLQHVLLPPSYERGFPPTFFRTLRLCPSSMPTSPSCNVFDSPSIVPETNQKRETVYSIIQSTE